MDPGKTTFNALGTIVDDPEQELWIGVGTKQ
jgi:hypothetical protein